MSGSDDKCRKLCMDEWRRGSNGGSQQTLRLCGLGTRLSENKEYRIRERGPTAVVRVNALSCTQANDVTHVPTCTGMQMPAYIQEGTVGHGTTTIKHATNTCRRTQPRTCPHPLILHKHTLSPPLQLKTRPDKSRLYINGVL